MKRKIFTNYVILIIIGITLTGFFVSQLTQKYYKYEVEQRLKNTAILIKHQVYKDLAANKDIDYNVIANNYSRLLNSSHGGNDKIEDIGMRITFIDFKGNVLGESEKDYHEMENHLNRKEIQEAINGNIGKAIRPSKTLNIDFLYIAVPIEESRIVIRAAVPLLQLEKIDRTIMLYSIAGILAGLVLTALLALRFSYSVTQPIKELISVSRDISTGNYSKRVYVKSRDEIGQLSDTFNEMALQLEKTVADLIDKNVKVDSIINSMISGIVAVDSSYRIMLINSMACEMFNIKNCTGTIGSNLLETIRNHQINLLLQETIEKNISLVNEIIIGGAPEDKVLRIYTNPIKSKDSTSINSGGIVFIQDITNIRKLEQIRTEFVSNVTHELKTPLTSIRGFIETLRGGAINDRDVAEKFLQIIDIEAERLYMLINDILYLSEIETKQRDANIHQYNLRNIVEEVLPILQSAAEKKNITLISEIEPGLKVVVNKDRIKQMLINLVDNGIKYNQENGAVAIKAYKAEGKVIISVKDTGIGIAKEHVSRIFERFYRVDKGRSRNMGGTGLGLSIVKHIVNLYNGDIRVNSEPGSGTEFIIQLPV